jgi:hypothetical protein
LAGQGHAPEAQRIRREGVRLAMSEKVDAMIGNRDGKFFDRLIPALIAAALGIAGTALVFWSDTRANDRETATAISRLNKEVDDLKRSDEAARLKTSELQADVKVILAIMQRIERKVDSR